MGVDCGFGCKSVWAVPAPLGLSAVLLPWLS
jgi:hypothetical protein